VGIEIINTNQGIYMSFLPVGSATSYQRCAQSLSFDLEDMSKKAQAFANNDEDIFNYIKDILNSSAFQSNPKGF
jgi:hypothetical protein